MYAHDVFFVRPSTNGILGWLRTVTIVNSAAAKAAVQGSLRCADLGPLVCAQESVTMLAFCSPASKEPPS